MLSKSDICPAAFSQTPMAGKGQPLINCNSSPQTPATDQKSALKSHTCLKERDKIKTIALPQCPGCKYLEYFQTRRRILKTHGWEQTAEAVKTCCCERNAKCKACSPHNGTRKALCTAKGALTKQRVPPAPILRYLPPILPPSESTVALITISEAEKSRNKLFSYT